MVMAGHSRPKPSVRLLNLLRPLLIAEGIPAPSHARLVSLKPSQAQREGGAWSWQLEPLVGPAGNTVGSQYSMGKLLVAIQLEVNKSASGDWHVDPIFAGSCG